MPNQDKIAPIKSKIKEASRPFMDTYEPEKPASSLNSKGSLVEPKGRSVNVSASAPKEETQSSPSGNLFEPDKSGNYGIRDKAPQDR